MILLKILTIATLCHIITTLGQIFDKPQQNELQIIKVTQLYYLNINNTVTLTFITPKLRQPNALITYDTIISNHFSTASPQVVSWFNIRFDNLTLTSIDVYMQAANEQIDPGLEYFTFSVMISCVDTRYFQIINYEYTGPRMLANVVNFFNVTMTPPPDPFGQCFSDAAKTIRQSINFMLTFNGFTGCNWLSMNRDATYYPSRSTFHIYSSNVASFNLALYSDHRTWLDKYWLGFLFICPNSYLLKYKYFVQFKYIGIGSQLICQNYSQYQANFISLTNPYPYLEFIGTRFISPNVNKTSGFTFVYNFTLDATQNASRRYYQAWQLCGMIDYNVLFIVQKYCSGNRTFVQVSGSCVCNNSMNFYDTGVVNCAFVCPSPLVDVNFQCKSCYDVYGLGCTSCTNLTCDSCDSNFILANNNLSCECINDRAIFNLTQCKLCSQVYDPFCTSCDNLTCLTCAGNYIYNISTSKCECTQGRLMFMSNCVLCQDLYGIGCLSCNILSCTLCDTNWTLISDGTCACISPNYIQVTSNNCQQPITANTSNTTTTGTTSQKFFISQSHIQLGSSLYIFLQFNHPIDEITQVIPLQANMIFTQGSQQIHSIKWIKNGMLAVEVELSYQMLQIVQQQNNTNNNNLSIQITNPKYLRWKHLSLQNQLQPITIQPFISQQSTQITILSHLCTLVQWLFPISILASWGVFNNGFQFWFIFAYYIHLKPSIYGQTESALVEINKTRFLTFLSQIAQLFSGINGINNKDYQHVQFTEIAMHKNTSIIDSTLGIIIVYLASILLCLSLRYYIRSKPINKLYVVYNNFIKHYKEYMFTNFMAIYSFMALPICVQFQEMFNTDWNLTSQSMFINLMVTAVIVIVMVIVPFIGLCIFPLNKQIILLEEVSQQINTYSVAYNKLYPSGIPVIIQHYLRIFRTQFFLITIFMLRNYDEFIAELIMIGYNLTYLLVIVINYKKYMTKLYWALCMVKNFLFVGFQIGFLFLATDYKPENDVNNGSSMISNDSVCMWLIILLIAFQIIELLVKTLRMLIANKYVWNELSLKSNKILPSEMEEIFFYNKQKRADRSTTNKK